MSGTISQGDIIGLGARETEYHFLLQAAPDLREIIKCTLSLRAAAAAAFVLAVRELEPSEGFVLFFPFLSFPLLESSCVLNKSEGQLSRRTGTASQADHSIGGTLIATSKPMKMCARV